jgi:hypothetical protein
MLSSKAVSCGSCKIRSYLEFFSSCIVYYLHLTLFLARRFVVTLMMEAIRPSEMLVLTKATRGHTSKDGILSPKDCSTSELNYTVRETNWFVLSSSGLKDAQIYTSTPTYISTFWRSVYSEED